MISAEIWFSNAFLNCFGPPYPCHGFLLFWKEVRHPAGMANIGKTKQLTQMYQYNGFFGFVVKQMIFCLYYVSYYLMFNFFLFNGFR